MKEFLKTSEIGTKNQVAYRAKMLGIVPLTKRHKSGELIYSIPDAVRIMSYKSPTECHNIKYYEVFSIMVEDPSLRSNISEYRKRFNIKEKKIQSMFDEYCQSGCFVTPSKMNYDEK